MWVQRFDAFVLFAEGLAELSDTHAHFPLQLSLFGGSGTRVSIAEQPPLSGGSGVLLGSGVQHALSGGALSVFVEPLTPLGRILLGVLGRGTHRVIGEAEAAAFFRGDEPRRWLEQPGGEDVKERVGALVDALVAASGSQPAPPIDARIQAVVERLRADLARTASRAPIAELARVANLSPGRLTHLFTEQVGLPIKQYFAWLRMVGVLERLSLGEPLGELAHRNGFADQAAFARAYREAWGRTPTSFRRLTQFLSEDPGDAGDGAAPRKRTGRATAR